MRSSEMLSVVSGDLGCRGQKIPDFIGKLNRQVICEWGREERDEEPKDVILSFQSLIYLFIYLNYCYFFNTEETSCLSSALGHNMPSLDI